jgi:hypothetical protein
MAFSEYAVGDGPNTPWSRDRIETQTHPGSSSKPILNLLLILQSRPNLRHRWHAIPSPCSEPPHLTLSLRHVRHARPFRVTCLVLSEAAFAVVATFDLDERAGDPLLLLPSCD